MRTVISLTILALLILVDGNIANAQNQTPSMLDLARNVDRAATSLAGRNESFLGFKTLELPKPLEGLLDIRFKKPTLPKLAFLEKLKNFGQPNLGASTTPTQGLIMASLSKLLPPRNTTQPSLLDRLLGKTSSPNASSLFTASEMEDLAAVTKGLQDRVGRMSQGVRANASDLFSGQNQLVSPQPPLRSARQNSALDALRF